MRPDRLVARSVFAPASVADRRYARRSAAQESPERVDNFLPAGVAEEKKGGDEDGVDDRAAFEAGSHPVQPVIHHQKRERYQGQEERTQDGIGELDLRHRTPQQDEGTVARPTR